MSGIKPLRTEWLRSSLRVAVGLLLVSPYIIWMLRISDWAVPRFKDWGWPLIFATVQGLVSTVCAFVLGFAMFCGLQWWTSSRGRAWAEISLLFPNVVPPLFLVMSLIGLAQPFGGLPYGLATVIFAHAFLNAGLVAVALDRLVRFKLGRWAETAWIMGASPRLFWREVGWPYLRGDLASVFLFVFSLCFTSFSIPLLLSGEHPTTLEVAIYDAIRMEGRWDKAVMLAGFQSLMLFLFSWLLPQSFWPQKSGARGLRYLAWPQLRSLPFLPLGILFLGWSQGLAAALTAPALSLPEGLMGEAILTTAFLAMATGLVHLVLFLLVAFVLPHERLARFLNGYLAPSPTITGFGLVLVPVEGDWINLLKLVVAMTLISFPLLYRWLGHATLRSLDTQVAVARALGASWMMILLDVVWPQAAPQILRASGMAALWAAGDFALSGILLGESQSLPLVMESLLGNYRIESAQLLLIPLVLVGSLVYGLFQGASRYVAN